MKFRHFISTILFSTLTVPLTSAQETIPVPSWKPGSVSYYSVHLKTSRDIKTKSAIALPEVPNEAKIDVSGILQVEVLAADPAPTSAGVRFRTHFLYLSSDNSALQRGKKPDQFGLQRAPADEKNVDCVFQSDGQITQIAGLDQLTPEQQDAWREWAVRFSSSFLTETEARKRSAKWNSEQPETSPSPIAELFWQRKSQYVHDEPCAPAKFNAALELQHSAALESCAVIFSRASLVQKSSPQDATPQDYKLHGLRTQGTAKGANEVILYISRKTGQLIRATQEATQQMDVLIVLSGAGNQVHYDIHAKANSSVELIADLPLVLRSKPAK